MRKARSDNVLTAPFLLPRQHYEALQALSRRSRIPMAAYVREALADLLKKHKVAT